MCLILKYCKKIILTIIIVMPRKQSGGSPASNNVNMINQGYLKALAEVPVGGQVHGLPGCQTGGSPASDRVNTLLAQEPCQSSDMPSTQQIQADINKLPLYKTSGGGKSKSKRRTRQKAGGSSDWVSTLYSRGPVNYPNNPDAFNKFAGPYDKFIENENLYYEGLADGSASNYAPWPFPQKGGKQKSHSKKSKKQSKKRSNKKRHSSNKKRNSSNKKRHSSNKKRQSSKKRKSLNKKRKSSGKRKRRRSN